MAGTITFAINGDASGFQQASTASIVQLARLQEAAARTTANSLSSGGVKSAGRALGATVSGLAMNASMFLGPEVASVVYPATFAAKELKTLAAAMKLTGAGIASIGVGFLGLVGVVGIAVTAFQAHKAKLLEMATEIRASLQQGQLRASVLSELFKNRDKLKPGEQRELSAAIRATDVNNQKGPIQAAMERLREIYVSKDQKAAQ